MNVDELWPHVQDARRFSDLCRRLNALGVLGLPAAVKWPIARELCARLGFTPTDGTFAMQLSPGHHKADRKEKNHKQVLARQSSDEGRERHREATRKASAIWKRENPTYHRNYAKERRKTDPQFATAVRLRSRLRHAIRDFERKTGQRHGKEARTLDLIGCTIPELLVHLESRFEPGMTLDTVHIDHVRPLASFDLANPEQVREAMHWTNLQPLWPQDNMSKGARWEAERVTLTPDDPGT